MYFSRRAFEDFSSRSLCFGISTCLEISAEICFFLTKLTPYVDLGSWKVILINFSIAHKLSPRNLLLNSFVYKSIDWNREYIKYKCNELFTSYPNTFTSITATIKYLIGFVSSTNAQNFLLFRSRLLNLSIFSKVSISLVMF